MPTRESAVAFEKLVAARDRLTEVTRLLNEAKQNSEDLALGIRASQDIQKRLLETWEQAYAAFVSATDEFHSMVHNLTSPDDSK